MKSIGKILSYMILILAAFVSLFPFYFMFVSGTNTNTEILSVSEWLYWMILPSYRTK